ncbi:hypothetical protein DEJ28_02690 [Curtobacterium sp. MCPF17_002]|uniref:hypothetical protein n=1 Tax=Curtobacterium sp. MCPF17_002 TaxID=2175645 RepID=UPI0024E0082F|nr:hypothetical protein [Curtobacterium sp. MCPF17_002]WIB78024.1 hypothetical protein DEJ28_02690 [Curtobacterium sp. MCPF17_002]
MARSHFGRARRRFGSPKCDLGERTARPDHHDRDDRAAHDDSDHDGRGHHDHADRAAHDDGDHD